MYHFYVLQSETSRDWLYQGSTPDLKKCLKEHNLGAVKATQPYAPLKLIYYETYLTKDAAIAREVSVKKGGSSWKLLLKQIHQCLE